MFRVKHVNAAGGAPQDDNSSTCAIIPNSTTGRALQAVAAAPDIVSPKGRKTALKQNRKGWLAAEQKEINAYKRNQTWSVIPQSQVLLLRRIIWMLWVYKIKRDGFSQSSSVRHAMGSAQKPGVDFDQTYSATMRASSLVKPPTGVVPTGTPTIHLLSASNESPYHFQASRGPLGPLGSLGPGRGRREDSTKVQHKAGGCANSNLSKC